MSSTNFSKPFIHSMDTHELFPDPLPELPGSAYSSHTTLRRERSKHNLHGGCLPDNRVFTLDLPNKNSNEKIRKTRNTGPSFSWKESFDLREFGNSELWKQAVLEGSGTCLLVWLTGLATYSLVPTVSDFTSGALFPNLLGSVVNAAALTLLIFSVGPISGGHVNPLITIGTFFGQLTTFPRALLYVICQTSGATVAGFLIRAALGTSGGSKVVIPGCWIDPSAVTAGEALVLETMSCLTLIILAYGVGLHPQNRAIYGPVLGPLLIGLTLGLCTFVTGALKTGYTGAGMNPARCFGLMAAEGRWDLHWVHWAGPIIAGALNGVLYWAVLPEKPQKI